MIDKALLLKGRLGEEEVEVPGLGSVRIRGLSRIEVMEMQDLGRVDAEVYLFHHGLVEPALTEDEARLALEAAPGGELQPIADALFALSGLAAAAVKEAVQSFPGQPGEESGVPRGEDLGDDGGPPTA